MPKKTWFADDFQPNFGMPWVPVFPKEELAKWPVERLLRYEEDRKYAERAAEENPVGGGWILPSWQEVLDSWKKYQTLVICGGNRCVRGDTLIYDPVLQVERRIDSIRGKHHVLAFDGTRMVVAEAEQPFQKGLDSMVRVTLTSGESFVASPSHVVLGADGVWHAISELQPGFALLHVCSISGTSLQGPPPDARHLTKTEPSYPGGCPILSHLDGVLPPSGGGSARSFFPSPDGAPKRSGFWGNIRRWLWRLYVRFSERSSGVPGSKLSRSRACGSSYPLSILGALRQIAARFAGILYRVSGKPCRWPLPLSVGLEGSGGQRSAVVSNQWRSTSESGQRGSRYCGVAYIQSMDTEAIDVKWDMSVPTHRNYYAAGIIHHNSSKSTLASRLAVWAACTIPEAEVRAYHVSEERSIEQQRFIWEAIPHAIKNLPTKKGQNHSLQYSQKNGFTDNICIFPPLKGYSRGGYIKFGNYKQYQQDAQIAEGFKAHLTWLDEEAPQKFFETLQYRHVDYHGRMVLTFTTLSGWTPLVQDIMGKTRTLKKKFAPLVKQELPIIQESLSRPGSVIFYFHTADNAFIDTKDFVEKLKVRPKDEILARAYGIPTKAISSAFPAFNKEVHVIPHEELPWVKDPEYKVTRYMAIDPGEAKSWFITWVAVDAAGTWWVYREWPDFDDWALPGNSVEGKSGPAQKASKHGIKDYVEMIRSLEKENEEVIFERFIDPRMGAAEKHTLEGASTIISDLDEFDMTVIPAPGVDITNGLQRIRNKLAWDDTRDRTSTNAPHFYISDRCMNTIYAMQEYTARGGSTEATKDPIDCLRYLAVSNIEYLEETKTDLNNQTGCY